MFPYYCFYLFVIGCCLLLNIYLENNRLRCLLFGSKTEDRTFYLLSIVVVLFIATRLESVGTDTVYYVNFFKHPKFLYVGEATDPMFEFFGRAIHFIWDAKEFFIFMTGLFSFFGIFYLIQKCSYNRVMSLTLFCIVGAISPTIFHYMCIIRQVTAMTYCFIGTYLLFEKYTKTHDRKTLTLLIICYILACSTHASCLFPLPFFILLYCFGGLKNQYWYILISVTYAMSAIGISFSKDIIGSIFSVFSHEHYGSYAHITFNIIKNKGWLNMNLIPFMAMAVMVMQSQDRKELDKWYCQLFLASVVLDNLFYDNYMWFRLILYFSIFVIIAIPNILHNRSMMYRWGCYAFIFAYFIYKTFSQLFHQVVQTEGNIIVPYDSWLF